MGRLRSAGGIGRCACGEPGEPGPSHMGRVLSFSGPSEKIDEKEPESATYYSRVA